MQKLLISLGIILVIAGLLWPWLSKLGLFRLPGDIYIEKENARFYFPITSAIIISIVISVILWFFKK
ncbi:DUF2905 domain-containing protein [Thiohalophilus sp.]|uniref:DUF2905 domain-containing protein n=1 Tax=Thiohalophilus sp. TaxID=3028392 RepID=UPI002ACD93B8|nr:DUF2905 domain-containing protein [Thiohalophilus sp.]MDZ7803836.1 DUF2905 domain-containing protein [Thiohalophilus sp.]